MEAPDRSGLLLLLLCSQWYHLSLWAVGLPKSSVPFSSWRKADSSPSMLHSPFSSPSGLGPSMSSLLPTVRLCLCLPAPRLPEPQLPLFRDQAQMKDGARGLVLWGVASPQDPVCNGPQDTTTRPLESQVAGSAELPGNFNGRAWFPAGQDSESLWTAERGLVFWPVPLPRPPLINYCM